MTRTHDIAADMVLEPRAIDVLVAEIRRYLEAVEALPAGTARAELAHRDTASRGDPVTASHIPPTPRSQLAPSHIR